MKYIAKEAFVDEKSGEYYSVGSEIDPKNKRFKDYEKAGVVKKLTAAEEKAEDADDTDGGDQKTEADQKE